MFKVEAYVEMMKITKGLLNSFGMGTSFQA